MRNIEGLSSAVFDCWLLEEDRDLDWGDFLAGDLVRVGDLLLRGLPGLFFYNISALY